MFGFLKWVREWREERQFIKETEAREAESQIQREERDNQQAEALLRTLHELQRSMDPLMALQVYNNRFCPLTGLLPEELLLSIIDALCDDNDVVALQCLRIVSRIFLRLLHRRSVVWREAWYEDCGISVTGNAFYLHYDSRLRFRRLLQRDDRCDNCRRWNNASNQASDVCKFRQNYRQLFATPYSHLFRELYCDVCQSRHDVCQFSSANQQLSRHDQARRCLGQQGSVQLCEHVQLTWANIKAHIDDWRQRSGGRRDWKDCLESFSIECHDNSHDTRCTISELPTWPRARLGTGKHYPDIVVLNLEWKPHSRNDALTLTTDGRVPASELRAVFHRLRSLGPVDTLCPPYRSGAMPEMEFFSPSSRVRRFVYYKTGKNDEMGPPSASLPPLPSYSWHFFYHHYGRGVNGRHLDIRPHYPRDAGGTGFSSQCLVTKYEKDIMICNTTAMTDPTANIVPTYAWLHAMDPRTYPHPQANHVRPQCKDEACINHFRNHKHCYSC